MQGGQQECPEQGDEGKAHGHPGDDQHGAQTSGVVVGGRGAIARRRSGAAHQYDRQHRQDAR